MDIRVLEQGDMDALSNFILDSFEDYPLAMWFDMKPPRENVERIFYNKIKGIGSRLLADMVATESGIIIGECEIVRTSGESGVVGIIIRKAYSHHGLGTRLLDSTIKSAIEIGILNINAEVMADNEPALRFFIVNGFAPVGSRDISKNSVQRKVVVLQRKLK